MATSVTPKTYVYHSYKSGAFQGILPNVITDFGKQQEINSAGSAITVVLGVAADSYSEGTIVDFNNKIVVYEIDDENPNGIVVYQGLLINYKPVFSSDDQERVELTIMGFGSTFIDYMIETGASLDVNSPTQQSTYLLQAAQKGAPGNSVIQSFTTGVATTKLSSINIMAAALTTFDVGDIMSIAVYANRTDAEGTTNLASPIAAATVSITSQSNTIYTVTFASPVSVSSATRYWVTSANTSIIQSGGGGGSFGVNLYYDSTKPLSSETMENNSSTVITPITGTLYLQTYSSTGSTTSLYSSQDPSAILKSIIDNYNTQGGAVTYTASSIDLTGTSVTYQFNTNTVLEGVNKCLDLAPPSWYWYVDEATNVLHFHQTTATPTHTLILGKHISNLSVEKRSQDIVNIIYFIGGPTAGVNLYNKYTLQSSINKYGRHAIRYTDTNVTSSATAQTIANSMLTERGGAELRIDIDIVDNGGNASSALGFNIEAIALGEMVSFRSLGPSSSGSLWDVSLWDVAFWDFNINDLSSVVVQVTKIDYKPDVLHLSLSTVPPDITKRMEYIYRSLISTQTLSNPSTPS